nr:autoinducer binding domain-containing protein [Mesorhizobium sp. M6A.T.Ce.TU.002.03.1.1]
MKPARPDPAVMLNYPDEWKERYSKMGYGRIDPIIKKSRKGIGAFRWSEVYKNASTENERRVLDEAAAFGLKVWSYCSIARPRRQPYNHELCSTLGAGIPKQNTHLLATCCVPFRLKLAKLPDSSALNQVNNLSPSEKEWVLWTARGKSSWEIGTILAVSRNTVDFHLKNVLRKLHAPSRTIAAFKSVGLGIVEIEKVLVPT